MKLLIATLALVIFILVSPRPAHADCLVFTCTPTPSNTPTDTPTDTPTTTATPTATPTNTPDLYIIMTLQPSGNPGAIVKTISVGESAIFVELIVIIVILLFGLFMGMRGK